VRVDPADWEASWQEIADSLELPPAADDASRWSGETLERYVGTYAYSHGGQEARCEVAFREGRLVVSGLAGVWRETPLVPVGRGGEARFALAAYPFEMTFELGERGMVRGARLSGPPPLFGSLPGRLVRAR
jgi:hypothetical protein